MNIMFVYDNNGKCVFYYTGVSINLLTMKLTTNHGYAYRITTINEEV